MKYFIIYLNEKHNLYLKLNDIRLNHEDKRVRFKAAESLGQFEVKENILFLLDSIDYEVFSIEEGDSIFPYFLEIQKIGGLNESGLWAIIPYILIILEKDRNDRQLFFYGRIFSFCYQMHNLRVAKCIREMALSINGVSKKKENLLRIAKILE